MRATCAASLGLPAAYKNTSATERLLPLFCVFEWKKLVPEVGIGGKKHNIL